MFNFSFQPRWQLTWRYVFHIGFLVLLHLNGKPDAVFKNKPEISSLVLKLLCITISKIIFTFHFAIDDIFTLLQTKDKVILDNLRLSYSLLAWLEFVNSNYAIVWWKTVLGATIEEANFICSDIVVFFFFICIRFIFWIIEIGGPFLKIWKDPWRRCPLFPKEASRRILEVKRNEQSIFHFKILGFHFSSWLQKCHG